MLLDMVVWWASKLYWAHLHHKTISKKAQTLNSIVQAFLMDLSKWPNEALRDYGDNKFKLHARAIIGRSFSRNFFELRDCDAPDVDIIFFISSRT